VIFVPNGDEKDHTRPPEFYDETFEFLRSCGLSAEPPKAASTKHVLIP
jgi:hypothetical protein